MTADQDASPHGYAQRLRAAPDEMADEQLRAVAAIIPELAGRDVAPLAHAAAVANLQTMATVLERGRVSDDALPPAVSALVRHLAWGGVEVDMLARAYRLGQDWLYEDIRSYCRDGCTTAEEAVALLGDLGQAALRFSDLSTTLVIEQYKEEREDLARNAYAKRAGTVRPLLDGAQVDLPALERTLGYGFSGPHTAVILSPADHAEGVRARSLRKTASDLIAGLDNPTSLVVEDRPDRVMVWIRAHLDRPRVEQWAAALGPTGSVRLAVGCTGIGLQGFRRTSQQAERAAAIGAPDEALVTYAEVSLVAVLLENPDTARAFMHEELGALAEAGETNGALRATLEGFLAHQCRFVPTARSTYLHRNTIAERLRRIENILGLSVRDRATELDAALRLHAYFSIEEPMPTPRLTTEAERRPS